MRIGEGFIEEIKENGLAKVRVSRDSLYVACSACAAADHVKIVAYNYLGADEGDRVRFRSFRLLHRTGLLDPGCCSARIFCQQQ